MVSAGCQILIKNRFSFLQPDDLNIDGQTKMNLDSTYVGDNIEKKNYKGKGLNQVRNINIESKRVDANTEPIQYSNKEKQHKSLQETKSLLAQKSEPFNGRIEDQQVPDDPISNDRGLDNWHCVMKFEKKKSLTHTTGGRQLDNKNRGLKKKNVKGDGVVPQNRGTSVDSKRKVDAITDNKDNHNSESQKTKSKPRSKRSEKEKENESSTLEITFNSNKDVEVKDKSHYKSNGFKSESTSNEHFSSEKKRDSDRKKKYKGGKETFDIPQNAQELQDNKSLANDLNAKQLVYDTKKKNYNKDIDYKSEEKVNRPLNRFNKNQFNKNPFNKSQVKNRFNKNGTTDNKRSNHNEKNIHSDVSTKYSTPFNLDFSNIAIFPSLGNI